MMVSSVMPCNGSRGCEADAGIRILMHQIHRDPHALRHRRLENLRELWRAESRAVYFRVAAGDVFGFSFFGFLISFF